MTDAEQKPPVPSVSHDAERGIDIIHLPSVDYVDTQVWSVDVGIDREGVYALRDALDQWLMKHEYPATGCNTSMACVMRNGCRRCRPDDHEEGTMQ